MTKNRTAMRKKHHFRVMFSELAIQNRILVVAFIVSYNSKINLKLVPKAKHIVPLRSWGSCETTSTTRPSTSEITPSIGDASHLSPLPYHWSIRLIASITNTHLVFPPSLPLWLLPFTNMPPKSPPIPLRPTHSPLPHPNPAHTFSNAKMSIGQIHDTNTR